jgi:hypothetical protein
MSRRDERRKAAVLKLSRVSRGEYLERRDPLCTAFHEASHCAFLAATGGEVEWVTCIAGTIDGEYYLGFTKSIPTAMPAISLIVETLSADIAEWGLWNSGSWVPGEGSGSDLDAVSRYMEKMGVKSWEEKGRIYNLAIQDAESLVKEAKSWIEALGIELYARKRMEGSEIRQFLQERDFFRVDNPLIVYGNSAKLMYAAEVERQKLSQKYSPEQMREIEERVQIEFNKLSEEKQEQLRRELPSILSKFASQIEVVAAW